MNRDMETELRRYQNSLRICGGGVIAFGLWSVLKVYLSFFFGEVTFASIIRESMETTTGPAVPGTEIIIWIVVLLVAFILGAIVFGLHLIVGLRAFRAAAGRKKPTGGYLILAGLFALLCGISIISAIRSLGRSEADISLATVFVDLTSLYIYLDLIRSAIQVKRYSARSAEGAWDHAG